MVLSPSNLLLMLLRFWPKWKCAYRLRLFRYAQRVRTGKSADFANSRWSKPFTSLKERMRSPICVSTFFIGIKKPEGLLCPSGLCI